MSVSSVTKMWSRDGGSTESDGKTITHSILEAWQVVHSADATAEEIRFATGLPRVNDIYAGTSFIFCRRVTPQKIGPVFSIVDVEYRGELAGPTGGTPISKPPVIRWQPELSNEAIDQDDHGLPFTNSAGDIVQGITTDIYDQVLYVQRNFISFNQYALRLYLRSVNSDYFGPDGALWPPGTAKLKDYSAEYVFNPTLGYWDVQARIVFRESYNTIAARAWWTRYLNSGLEQISRTKVTFSSPGASGRRAMGYAVVDKATGSLSGIALTSRGSGYSSAPTISIVSTDGSGASATCTINAAGEVLTLTLTNGGSNYKLGKSRCVDDNKEPATEPKPLNYDGSQLFNSEQGVWIERPVGVFPLPYQSLGLL